jgi:hypothetical protein
VGDQRGIEARPGETPGGAKKLIERAEWDFGEAGEIAAATASTERALRRKAAAEGREYVPAFEPPPEPPDILEENAIAWDMFDSCRTQLILGGFGTVVGVSHAKLPWLMERFEVPEEEQLDVDEKFRLIESVFVKACNSTQQKGKGGRG